MWTITIDMYGLLSGDWAHRIDRLHTDGVLPGLVVQVRGGGNPGEIRILLVLKIYTWCCHCLIMVDSGKTKLLPNTCKKKMKKKEDPLPCLQTSRRSELGQSPSGDPQTVRPSPVWVSPPGLPRGAPSTLLLTHLLIIIIINVTTNSWKLQKKKTTHRKLKFSERVH